MCMVLKTLIIQIECIISHHLTSPHHVVVTQQLVLNKFIIKWCWPIYSSMCFVSISHISLFFGLCLASSLFIIILYWLVHSRFTRSDIDWPVYTSTYFVSTSLTPLFFGISSLISNRFLNLRYNNSYLLSFILLVSCVLGL